MHYAEIFAHRGDAYHSAMRRYPAARDLEFRALFLRHPARMGERILDVPSGGGYLKRTLADGVDVTSLELTAGFGTDVRVVDAKAEWGVRPHDHAVSLAGLHHIDDQTGFVAKLVAHTKRGGIVHIADVDADQALATFLDGFVGRHNGTGHEGRYLSAVSFCDQPGVRIVANEMRECPWQFETESALLDFCAGLFDLKGYSASELRAELARHVGIASDASGVRLRWSLRYIDLEVL